MLNDNIAVSIINRGRYISTTQHLQFIASKDGANINLFGDSIIPNDCYYTVNGERQTIPINNLSFKADDVVTIVYFDNSFDSFICKSQNYFKRIVSGSIPRIDNIQGDFDCFYQCSDLISICSSLLFNNSHITNFTNCFYGCSSLQEIPTNLFKHNTEAVNFSYCFYGCSSLTSIPSQLFA